MIGAQPASTLFPYTTLFRSTVRRRSESPPRLNRGRYFGCAERAFAACAVGNTANALSDRKSTRLNSSHVATSYAVVCLKKKITFIAAAIDGARVQVARNG